MRISFSLRVLKFFSWSCDECFFFLQSLFFVLLFLLLADVFLVLFLFVFFDLESLLPHKIVKQFVLLPMQWETNNVKKNF